MNIFKKTFLKWAIWSAEKTGYTMQKIGALRYASLVSLYKKWELKEYEKWESARILAQAEEHWFEELQILIDEISLLIKTKGDKQLFCEANARLLELSQVFDMGNEAFIEKFKENYLCFTNQQILKQINPCLKGFYNYFYERADFMLAHLQYNAAILCGKAICKIAAVSNVVSFEEYAEALFQIAIAYGNIREFSKAMEYYDTVIEIAKQSEDITYEYIAIIRKLTICITAMDMNVLMDIDCDRIRAVKDLLDLCNRYALNPYELGDRLIQEEASEFRKDRIRECKPCVDNLLSLQRGDWQTSLRSAQELKEAEAKVYGGGKEFSSSEMLKNLYLLLHNPASREHISAKIDEENVHKVEDIPYTLHFPHCMLQSDRFRMLLFHSKAEIAQEHKNASISLAHDAMEIAKDLFSDYHMAVAINAIGQAYEHSGNKSDAIEKYNIVVDMFKRDNHLGSDIFISQQLMYNCLFEIGNLQKDIYPQKAIEAFNEALSLIEKSTDIDKEFFKLYTLLNRSVAYKRIGKIDCFESDLIDTINIVLSQTSRRLKYMDGDLRVNFWNEINKLIRQIVSLCEEDHSDVLRTKVYELILFSKGFLLSSEHAVKSAISSEDFPDEIHKIYEELEDYEQKRNQWGTSTENSSDEYINHYMQRMRLTCAMLDVIDEYSDFLIQDFQSIVDSLSCSDVILDFYDYPINHDDYQYLLFAYTKKDKAPHVLKVCKESEIQSIFDDVTGQLYTDGQRFHFTEAYNTELEFSNRLYDTILKSVTCKLNLDFSYNIYIVPSGSLHKIPLESLVVSLSTRTIVSDYYNSIKRISHARVVKNAKNYTSLDNIALYGGLDYACNDEMIAQERGCWAKDKNECASDGVKPWNNLYYSLREVGNIAFMWESQKGRETVRINTLADGTTNSFGELSGQRVSVIHFATHGFFETEESAATIPALKGRYNPMDLSGIVLSNGNIGWLYGTPMSREGILTSSDISKLDLRNTSLVVLSVCDSGNGVVHSDEFYGLQRAFKKAGVRNIIMSLWNESDEAGMIFMTKFYHNLLISELSLTDSFNKAKNDVRLQYNHPVYWSNFVMIE